MRRLASLPVILVMGCGSFAPPPDGERINPPAEYRALFDSAQACTGRTGNFDHLTFIVVPGEYFECRSGRCVGHYEDDTIWLSEAARDHPLAIKHELIHYLGIKGHPHRPFVDPCQAMYRGAA